MLKVSEVVRHIENMYNVTLTDIQKDMVKHVIAGDTIYTPRACGRSMIYEGYADYLKNVISKGTDYSIDPLDFDKVYTYKDVVSSFFYPGALFKEWKEKHKEKFEMEFECKYKLT